MLKMRLRAREGVGGGGAKAPPQQRLVLSLILQGRVGGPGDSGGHSQALLSSQSQERARIPHGWS